MSFEKLRPILNTVLFTFLDKTEGAKGAFSERTRGGIILPTVKSTQRDDRWGRVEAVGPDVYGLEVGEFILIEALQWNRSEVFEGDKLWKTDDTKILLVTTDENLTVNYG
jgi:co-chaperonin GroES (HSP10)